MNHLPDSSGDLSGEQKVSRLFKITCVSDCGSYFASYLQSVTLLADTEEEARENVKKWGEKEGTFIYGENKWEVEELKADSFGVVDYLHDSDY